MMFWVFLLFFVPTNSIAKASESIDLAKFEKTVSELQSTVAELKSDIKNLKISNANLQKSLTMCVSNSTKESSKRFAQTEVAFSASLRGDIHGLHTHETVKYDREVIDTANAYDPSTGIFTVPITGVYVFTWAVVGYYETTELIVDGNQLAYTQIDSGDSGDLGSGSQTVIIAVKQQQHVYIRIGQNDGDRYLRGTNYNSFSGWLLFMNE